jgi:hypothetical protein
MGAKAEVIQFITFCNRLASLCDAHHLLTLLTPTPVDTKEMDACLILMAPWQ